MQTAKFVFVSDYFADKVNGGAELSTQALIDTCPGEVIKIKSDELSREEIDQHRNAYWIFTNVWKMKWNLIPAIVHALRYSVIEYDYKYCGYRSPDIHHFTENQDCNCSNILLDEFYSNADEAFFMSERQRDWLVSKIGEAKIRTSILSSIFADESLDLIDKLYLNKKQPGVWAIVYTRSGLKGFDQTIAHAENEGLNYLIFKDLSYEDLLKRLSTCHGLIYKPIGGDTCPRLVIEAKLLGLELDINYFVQHQGEEWFNATREETMLYLRSTKKDFWGKVMFHVDNRQVNV